jgi:hypothetical protein
LKNKDASVPASIRLLIPRVLPAIYDIRNTRGVAHVGDISTHGMDASFVLPACSWVLAELVRVFTSSQPTAGAKSFSVEEGQALVDELTKQPVLVVWQDGKVKRVLDITLNLYDQIVLLAAAGPISKDDVRRATEHYTDDYLETVLRGLHTRRLIEFRRDTGIVTLTSLGAAKASSLATAWRKGQSID